MRLPSHRRMLIASLAAVSLGTVAVSADTRAFQTATPPRVWTGTIRGIVLDREARVPLRRASIRATSPALPDSRDVLTNDEGRFEFTGLPPGAYALRAAKRAYVTQPFGRIRSADAPVPIQVTPGDAVAPIEFQLSRGAVITGRVFDELGDPLDTVTVRILASEFTPLGRRLRTIAASLPTNDLGEYRVAGLPAGRYVVAAVAPDAGSYGGSSATVLDTSVRPPTYFPGTADPGLAERISVALGQTVAAIDVTVGSAPAAAIRGRVRELDGASASGRRVAVISTGADFEPVRVASVATDGMFSLTGVPAGDYVLRATSGDGTTVSGETPVSVSGGDVDQVDIEMRPPAVLPGRIRVAKPGVATPRFESIRLRALDVAWGARAGGLARVTERGTFRLASAPGRVLLRLADAPRGWTLQRVLVDGQDVTDRGIDVAAGTTAPPIELWITNDDPELVVTVVDVEGRPVRDAWVVAFSTNREHWTFGSRFVARGRPDRDGRYRQRLPAGDYLIAAVDALEPGDEFDPRILAAVDSLSVSLVGRSGGVTPMTVTVQRP